MVVRGKILILKTGELPPGVCVKHGSCERQFLNFMGEDQGVVVVDARRAPLPEADWAGIIVTGSGSSAFDSDLWIRASGDFLKRAEEKGSRIYGVCFGHQLLAQTFGGRVERCAHGWELGTAPIRILAESGKDKLFAGMPSSFLAQETHRDVVTELPRGAIRLAENDHAQVQAFRLGERVWGTQFHPEFNRALMGDMIECLAEDLPREQFACRPANRPLKDWLLAGLRETAEASKCLRNFVRNMAAVLIVLLAGLAGCSTSQETSMPVNPSTGLVARCDLLRKDMVEKCVQAAEKQGYVLPEKLTPEQRAALGRQGLISTDQPIPEPQNVFSSPVAVPQRPGPSIP